MFKQAIAYLTPSPTPATDPEPTSTTTTESGTHATGATATDTTTAAAAKPKKSKYLRYIRIFLLVNTVLLAAPLGIARVVSNYKNFNGKLLGYIDCILY